MRLATPNHTDAISRVSTFDKGANTTTYEARPSLYVLIGKKKWDEVKQRIESNPEECKIWVTTEYGLEGCEQLWWKRLPVHLACERRPDDVNAMKRLIDSFPDSLYMKDETGRVPLIHACSSRASLDIVKLLLSEGPDAPCLPDSCNRLALHWACEYDATLEVVSAVLNSYPDASKQVDMYGRVPLHWECASLKCSPQTVSSLIQCNPDAISMKDLDGNTPLELMKHSLSLHRDQVIELLQTYMRNETSG